MLAPCALGPHDTLPCVLMGGHVEPYSIVQMQWCTHLSKPIASGLKSQLKGCGTHLACEYLYSLCEMQDKYLQATRVSHF